MKDMTVLKIVDGASIPRPSGFNGAIGCRHNTTKPNTNSATLNTRSAIVYCFQSCGPVSMRLSAQRKMRGALYLPSINQAK